MIKRMLFNDDRYHFYEKTGKSERTLGVAIPYGRAYRLRLMEKEPTVHELEALLSHLKELNEVAS